jgi:hypothetical protein
MNSSGHVFWGDDLGVHRLVFQTVFVAVQQAAPDATSGDRRSKGPPAWLASLGEDDRAHTRFHYLLPGAH